MADMLEDLYAATGYPLDFCAGAMLWAIGLAAGAGLAVAPSPGWQERAVFYMALVGPPGSCKTPPLRFALAPFYEMESMYEEQFKEATRDFQARHHQVMQSEAHLGLAAVPEKTTSKTSNKTQTPQVAQGPTRKHLLVNDTTPEALIGLMAVNPRGLGLHADELASWFENFNRYQKGNEEAMWLSAYSGEPIKQTRATKEPLYIPRPFLCVIGGIQPGVLTRLSDKGRKDNGFMHRMTFVAPPTQGLSRFVPLDEPLAPLAELEEQVVKGKLVTRELRSVHESNKARKQRGEPAAAWRAMLKRLLMRQSQQATEATQTTLSPTLVPLGPEAQSAFKALHHWRSHHYAQANSEWEQGLLAKTPTLWLRLALALEAAYFAAQALEGDHEQVEAVEAVEVVDAQAVEPTSHLKQISPEAATGAMLLLRYFTAMAYRVEAMLKTPATRAGVTERMQAFFKPFPKRFTLYELKKRAEAAKIPWKTIERWLTSGQMTKRVGEASYEKREGEGYGD